MIKPLQECLVCGAVDLDPVLDLGQVPLANALLADPTASRTQSRYALQVNVCGGCRHVQLTHSVTPEAMFSEYVFPRPRFVSGPEVARPELRHLQSSGT